MRLSEAIALGVVLGTHVIGAESSNPDSGCALQLAARAVGAAKDVSAIAKAESIWPWVKNKILCPACALECSSIGFIIAAHLNDKHHWSLERIADWVRSVEPAEPEIAVVPELTLEEELASIT